MQQALIKSSSGRVVNIIVVGDDYTPPPGHELQTADGAAKHMIWNGVGYDARPQSDLDAIKAKDMDMVFREDAVLKVLYYLGKEQGMFKSLEEMRIWVDTHPDPPATFVGGP